MRSVFGRNTFGRWSVMGLKRDADEKNWTQPTEAERQTTNGKIPAFPTGYRKPNDED